MATTHPSGRRRIIPKDAMLYAPGESTRNLHRVEEGVVRQCLYLSDGQRVIAGFAFPGDVIGALDDQPMVTAEAATSTLVFEWTIDPGADPQQCASLLSQALHQTYLTMAIRSRKHARARLAAFLLDLAERRLGSEFRLPLTLVDLADHLGLTQHTISRTLTEFRRSGVLRQASGHLFIINHCDPLREIANEGPRPHPQIEVPTIAPGRTD